MNLKTKISRGFTLVEIMVAVSLFAIVAVITTGALVTANNVNRKAQAIKVAIDNLNFAIDSVILNLHSGKKFHCIKDMSSVTTWSPTYDTLDFCSGAGGDSYGNGIAFSVAPCTPVCQDKIIYGYKNVGGNGSIQLWRNSNPSFIDITSPEINISTFKVYVGTDPARALLVVQGNINDNTNTQFSLENTIYGQI